MQLSIGDLANVTGETVKTLRYWTDQGLLDTERGENNYRYYSLGLRQVVCGEATLSYDKPLRLLASWAS
jgi:hypothetical protein